MSPPRQVKYGFYPVDPSVYDLAVERTWNPTQIKSNCVTYFGTPGIYMFAGRQITFHGENFVSISPVYNVNVASFAAICKKKTCFCQGGNNNSYSFVGIMFCTIWYSYVFCFIWRICQGRKTHLIVGSSCANLHMQKHMGLTFPSHRYSSCFYMC